MSDDLIIVGGGLAGSEAAFHPVKFAAIKVWVAERLEKVS